MVCVGRGGADKHREGGEEGSHKKRGGTVGLVNYSEERPEMSKEDHWSVVWLRPDGWDNAGDSFTSKKQAKQCAKEQLPAHTTWKVMPNSDPRCPRLTTTWDEHDAERERLRALGADT